MFYPYLQLRSRCGARLLKGIGVFRSFILLLMAILATIMLLKAENRWVLPALCACLLASYHNQRKDRLFLLLHVKDKSVFFRKEYGLLAFPFIVIGWLKGNWPEIAGLLLFALLLPGWKGTGLKIGTRATFPFLHKGSMEYIRMFRQYRLLYLLLLCCVAMGAAHGNITFAKVCFIGWCLIQTTAYSTLPDRISLCGFKRFATFFRLLAVSSWWNVFLTGALFAGIIIGFSPGAENLFFLLSAAFACSLYLLNLGLIRQVCYSAFGLVVYQLVVLAPLFFFSCFLPYMLAAFVFVTGVVSFPVAQKLKRIWN